MLMNKLCLLIISSLIYIGSIFAQSADEQIGEAINASDLFLLQEKYDSLKGQVQTPMLHAFSEALLNTVFNYPEHAVKSIDGLVTHFQGEIGFDNVKNMLDWQNHILFRMGEYCDASNRAASFMEQVAPHMDTQTLEGMRNTARFYKSMCGEKKSELIRPAEDCVIPLYIEPLEIKGGRKGHMPYITAIVNGIEERFIFDTGCPGGLFLSEEYARKLGVRVTLDSLQVNGAGGSDWGKMGILDSIIVGNMTFKNLVVTIVPPNPAVDTIFKMDRIIGSDIMLHAGEVQIYPKEQKIVFPVRKTPMPATGRNILKMGNDLFLAKVYSGEERLIMFLDTGDSASGMSFNYYEKNKETIDRIGEKASVLTGGFGGVLKNEYYTIPSLPLRIGEKSFEMKDIGVGINPHQIFSFGNNDGSLGMAFINLFDKVTINFNDMFIEVE